MLILIIIIIIINAYRSFTKAFNLIDVHTLFYRAEG